MQSVELFSGTGGLAKGLEKAGFDHVALVEHNKDACASLRLNFDSGCVFHGDIRDFDLDALSHVDIVAGGPPCQPFSLGGKHKAHDDTRDMFPYAIKAIEKLAPKAFVFENVKGLLRESFSEYFEYIILRLSYPDFPINAEEGWRNQRMRLKAIKHDGYSGIKYDVSYKLLNAADYGVPQMRERVLIVGVRSDLNSTWEFPKATHSKARLLWDQYVSKEYWQNHGVAVPECSSFDEYTQQMIERLRKQQGMFPPEGKPWRTIRDALVGIPSPQLCHDIIDHRFKDGAKCYPGHTGSALDWPSKTIKAGGHGVPGGENMMRFNDGSVRYFTVHEAKLLQTFPPDFMITGAWGEAMRQIGNAVPVLMAEIIGRQLYSVIAPHTIKKKVA
jgi:DNA (cytosine-5)-methyltransferase 1